MVAILFPVDYIFGFTQVNKIATQPVFQGHNAICKFLLILLKKVFTCRSKARTNDLTKQGKLSVCKYFRGISKLNHR